MSSTTVAPNAEEKPQLQSGYMTVLDGMPQQYQDSTKLWSFYDALRDGRLTTTRCQGCSALHWPPRTVCPECMSDDLTWEDIPMPARIYSYTVQVAGVPPEFPPPLVYALIDFENGLRLFTAIVDCEPSEVSNGAEVDVVVRDVAPDQYGRPRVMPYFRLRR